MFLSRQEAGLVFKLLLSLLRAAAKMTQVAFYHPEDNDKLYRRLSLVRRVMTKLEDTLYEEYEEEQ